MAVSFEITDGPDMGTYITWTGSLTEKAAPHTLKALAVCGAPRGKTLDELTVDDLTSFVSLVVEYETHEGKSRPRVKWVNRPGGGFKMKHPIVGAELRKLGAEWKADFDQTERYEPIEVPEPTSRPAKESAQHGDQGETDDTAPPQSDHPFAPGTPDDDIPF